MTSSSYIWRESYANLAAEGHGESSTGGNQFDKAWAAFSLHTTPRDYSRFLIETLRDGATDAFRLSSGTLKSMLSPQIRVNDFCAWGLGWGIELTDADQAFWHWGDNGNFKCFALASRQQQNGIVIMTNGDHWQTIYQPLVEAVIGGRHPCSAADFLNNL
jgi:CubicO group peptidase (beta-lactamase class C family)